MHSLSTDQITASFPTQIVGVAYGAHTDTPPGVRITAFVSVEINGVSHVCEVAKPPNRTFDTERSIEMLKEWNEVTENSEIVPRTVTLIAKPSSDIVGTATFDISQIDLRTEEGDERYFVTVIK